MCHNFAINKLKSSEYLFSCRATFLTLWSVKSLQVPLPKKVKEYTQILRSNISMHTIYSIITCLSLYSYNTTIWLIKSRAKFLPFYWVKHVQWKMQDLPMLTIIILYTKLTQLTSRYKLMMVDKTLICNNILQTGACP